jgi:hypothetical protein
MHLSAFADDSALRIGIRQRRGTARWDLERAAQGLQRAKLACCDVPGAGARGGPNAFQLMPLNLRSGRRR